MKHRISLLLTTLLALAILLAGTVTAFAAADAAAPGTGPDDALAPSGDWQPLNDGENHWYAFHYAGDGSQIQVRMDALPEEGASFTVWTPEEIRQWRAGSEVSPIGRGSTNPAAQEALLWSGNFSDKGTYYVVVEPAGNKPGTTYYLLTVGGDGVSLAGATPATPGTSTAATKKTQPRAATPADPTGRLVFQTGVGGALYTINADGSNLQRISAGMDPSWSPNGRHIAFIRWQEPRGVWVVDTETGNEWRVFDWSEPRWTSWSPGGDEILFARVTGGRQEAREFCFRGFCFSFPAHPHWKTGVVSIDGSSFYEPKPPDSQTSRAPNWSPVGDRVAFADVQGLRVQNLDGSDSYQITGDSKDTSPAWSPDGERIAFVRRQHDHWEIYVVGADGGNLQRLTNTPIKPDGEVGNSASPAWSPDGNHIAFLTDRTGEWEIWIMLADGSGQQPMFPSALVGLTLDYASQGELAISWTE